MKTPTKQNCVFCGAPINPQPLAQGRCCGVCESEQLPESISEDGSIAIETPEQAYYRENGIEQDE